MSDHDASSLDGIDDFTFHFFAEFPAEPQLRVIQTAVRDQRLTPRRLPQLACVSSTWQKEVERATFHELRLVHPEDITEMKRICVGARPNVIRTICLFVEVPNTFLNPSGRHIPDATMEAMIEKPDASLTDFISDYTAKSMTTVLNMFKDCEKEDRVGGQGLDFMLRVGAEGKFAKGHRTRKASEREYQQRTKLLRVQNVVVPLKLDALQPIRVLTGLQLGDWYQTFAVTPWSLVSLLDKLPSLASLSFEEGPKSIVTKMARRDNFRKSSVRFLIMTA